MKTPPVIAFDWKEIEDFRGSELSIDARSRIEGAVSFYYSVPKHTKLEDGKVPTSMLLDYSKKLDAALKCLERLPEAAQQSLMISDLRVHVWHATRVAKPEEDKSSIPWDFLILTCAPKTPPKRCRVCPTKGQTNEEAIHGRTDNFDAEGTGGW